MPAKKSTKAKTTTKKKAPAKKAPVKAKAPKKPAPKAAKKPAKKTAPKKAKVVKPAPKPAPKPEPVVSAPVDPIVDLVSQGMTVVDGLAWLPQGYVVMQRQDGMFVPLLHGLPLPMIPRMPRLVQDAYGRLAPVRVVVTVHARNHKG
jgi:hypothetical protein